MGIMVINTITKLKKVVANLDTYCTQYDRQDFNHCNRRIDVRMWALHYYHQVGEKIRVKPVGINIKS